MVTWGIGYSNDERAPEGKRGVLYQLDTDCQLLEFKISSYRFKIESGNVTTS